MTTCDLVGLNLCAWKLGQNISKEYEGELSAMPSPEQVALLCRYMYLCILKIAFTDIFSIITVIKVQQLGYYAIHTYLGDLKYKIAINDRKGSCMHTCMGLCLQLITAVDSDRSTRCVTRVKWPGVASIWSFCPHWGPLRAPRTSSVGRETQVNRLLSSVVLYMHPLV